MFEFTLRSIEIALLASPIAGLVWAFALVRARNRLLYAAGVRCLACGYDLTGNVSGRCPECGAFTDATIRGVDAEGY